MQPKFLPGVGLPTADQEPLSRNGDLAPFGALMSSQSVVAEPSTANSTITSLLARGALASFIVCTPAVAHDKGQFNNVSPATRTWFHNVKSPRGIPCCDIADGHRTEFDMRENRYWVPINGTWMPVPQEAVLTDVGNPVGDAVVWYSIYGDQVIIRCFVPGDGA